MLRLIKGKHTAVLHRYNKGRPTEVHRFDGTQRNLNFLSVGHNYKVKQSETFKSVVDNGGKTSVTRLRVTNTEHPFSR